jgi:hypothetical protein
MTTNILQLLHTTAAYQGAAAQLMVNEANFAAKQLDLKETIPAIVATDSRRWEVDPPPNGIGGAIQSENYLFWFNEGKLRSITKLKWFEKVSPPIHDVVALADRPSLLDTNSAYALAKQQLAALSVDVAALERKHPPNIFQLRAKKRGPDGEPLPGPATILAVPLFMIGWGEDQANPILRERLRQLNRPLPSRPPSALSPVFVELLGTTRELLELKINDASLITRPALQLTNASELLGEIPPPKHFVEQHLGGPAVYRAIETPDKVEAWLLNQHNNHMENADRAGPVQLKPAVARQFSETLLKFDSYFWSAAEGVSKGCIPDYGARLRFTRGSDIVDVHLCYECNILQITHAGGQNHADFDPAHAALVKALQAVFPTDPVVKSLK